MTFSVLTSAIARQYDAFQATLESMGKERKFLNYGYTVNRAQSYEQRQEKLCLEVFDAAAIGPKDVIVDVGFGSGEQDFLLSKTYEFARLIGINISARQVQFASERARKEKLEDKLSFRLGEAEALDGIENGSVDRLLSIECAFYFDRPRFYKRAMEVLRPGGLAILADISFSDRMAWLARRTEDLQRVGTQSSNRVAWGKYFRTRSVRDIRKWTWRGAQMTVFQILRTAPFSQIGWGERREWLKMAFYSQLVSLGLLARLIHYDLIVLEAGGPGADAR